MTAPKRGLKSRAPLNNPLEDRKKDRNDAHDGIFTRSRTEDTAGPEPEPAPARPVDENPPPTAAPATAPKTPAATPKPTAAPAMPPAKPTPEPSVQFGPRIRDDIAQRLAAFCADFGVTKQDTVDMALAEWLARRGYRAVPDIVVPDLPGPVNLEDPAPVDGDVPMPPRKSGNKRRQLNVRIRPEVNRALIRFVTDRPSVVQDIADMAIAEFLAVRESSLQPANTSAS